jgi:predicted DNA repair protein MutK
MSGLLALLDDVAAIVKLTATQVDDFASQAAKVGAKVSATVLDDAAKAGAKAAGVVIDDAAVTPKYVTGLPAKRELPIIWKIARASFFNKLVILLPAALLLDIFLPWLVTPLLMLGGCYLCFEGAEKVWHWLHPHPESHAQEAEVLDAAHLEEMRVKGAIKTDFILSAEIMTISLAAIETDSRLSQGLVLAVVAIGITALVYGAVALLVKMDDAGLRLAQIGPSDLVRNFGRGLVKFMPTLMMIISFIGTAAMLWVGGNIIVHGLHNLGIDWPYEPIKNIAKSVGGENGFVKWAVTAALDGVLGIILGLALMPIVNRVIVPVFSVFFPEKKAMAH